MYVTTSVNNIITIRYVMYFRTHSECVAIECMYHAQLRSKFMGIMNYIFNHSKMITVETEREKKSDASNYLNKFSPKYKGNGNYITDSQNLNFSKKSKW